MQWYVWSQLNLITTYSMLQHTNHTWLSYILLLFCQKYKYTSLRKTRPRSAQPGSCMTKSATCWMVHWDSESAWCSATPGNSLACSSQQNGRSLGGGGGCGGGDDTPDGMNTLWCMLWRRFIARSAAETNYVNSLSLKLTRYEIYV